MEINDQEVEGAGKNEEMCDKTSLRPKRRRKLVSYCETKTRSRKSRSMSDSKVGDNDRSLSPTSADNLKENGILHKRLKSNEIESREEKCLPDVLGLKNEVKLMRVRTKTVSDLDKSNNCFLQTKQEKKGRRSSRHSSSLNVSKQLTDSTASKSSGTKLEETNFCAQLMKLEKVDCDDLLDVTGDTKDNRKDTDTTPAIAKQIRRHRSCKRKTTFGRESVADKKTGCENDELNNSNEIEPYSVSDGTSVESNYESMCTSTPVNKRFQRNRKRKKSGCSEACSFDTSMTLSSHEDFLSEQNIPCGSSPLPTPIAVSKLSKSGLPELDAASISPPTSLKSSCLYTSMETSLDKSCFADSADSCIVPDQSIESDSDEEDLPLGITPAKLDRGFSPNDVVWVKQKSMSYLPALVQEVYRKKKRLKLTVFKKNGFQDSFTMSHTKRDNILSYWHPKRTEILQSALSMSLELRNQFNESVSAAENFLLNSFKKVDEDLSSIKDDSIIQSEDLADDKPSCHDMADSLNDGIKGNGSETNTIDCSTNINMLNERKCEKNSNTERTSKKVKDDNNSWSKKGLIRKQKRSEWTKPLTDFMKTKEMKKHLEKIYKGQIVSNLHEKFYSKSRQDRIKIKQHGFGPIEDEDQINTVLEVYIKWLQDLDTEPVYTKTNYMFDVWFPEAVVYALKKIKKYSSKRAWEMFEKGISRTKAELKIIYPEYIGTERKRSSRKMRSFVEID